MCLAQPWGLRPEPWGLQESPYPADYLPGSRGRLPREQLMKDRKFVRGRWLWAMFGALWLVAVIAGLVAVARYDNTAAAAAVAPGHWPERSQVVRDPSGPTLVMLAHPRCTCTRASLAELAEIMARATHRPRAYVVFVKAKGLVDGWETTDLLQRATRIPDVTIVRDDQGIEAGLFGAETSGQIFLYDREGELLFSGGTTGSRGHTGDNAGRASILALLNHADAHQASAPVFGCSLFSSGDTTRADEATHQ